MASKTKMRLRPDIYQIVSRAVSEGVICGLYRYMKYHDTEVRVDSAAEHIEREVLNALCEVIRFDDKER